MIQFIIIGVLAAAVLIGGKLLFSSYEENARIEGEYTAFREGVKKKGDEAEKKRKDTEATQKEVDRERTASLEKRVAANRIRADGLCKSAGLSAGCRDLSGVPESTRPADAAARDQRLLEVLRHSQDQADRLIELQEWARQQGAVR